MSSVARCLLTVTIVLMAMSASATPLLDAPVPLPAKFTGIITIYPDSDSTAAVRRFWIVPSTVRIVRLPLPKNTLSFGLIHSGVSSFDPVGIHAVLNVTIQPYVDDPTLQEAKALVEQQAKAEGATSVSFNFIAPSHTEARLLLGGQYAVWSGQNAIIVDGGSAEAGIPFSIGVDKSFDVRALTQAGGPNAALFGVEARMKFWGLGTPCQIHLHAKFEETYKHFVARVKASGWFGLTSHDWKYETQELRKVPGLTLDVKGCTDEQFEKFHAQKMFDDLFNAINNRTGLFAKELHANGLPDAPGGGGWWGWNFNSGGGFESYTDTTDFDVNESVTEKREQEILYGLNFPAGGDEMKQYVKNLTDVDKPFPTSDDFKKQADQHKACRTNNVTALKNYLANGTIDQNLYNKLIEKALEQGCFVDYTTNGLLMKRALQLSKSGSKLSVADILRSTLPQ